jgi:hypothetical protein
MTKSNEDYLQMVEALTDPNGSVRVPPAVAQYILLNGLGKDRYHYIKHVGLDIYEVSISTINDRDEMLEDKHPTLHLPTSRGIGFA